MWIILKTDIHGRSQLMHAWPAHNTSPRWHAKNMASPPSKKHESIEEEQYTDCPVCTNWYHVFSPSGQKAASSLMQENRQFSCYRPILGTDRSLWLLASLSINPTIKPRTGELPHQVRALAVCQAQQLEFGPQHPQSRGEHWLPQVAFWSPYACCSIHTTLLHNQVSVI